MRLIHIPFILTLAIMASSGLAFTKKKMCEVSFPFDSTDFDEQELVKCFDDVEKDAIEYFHVFATASYPGTLRYNRDLSEKRAKAIREILNKHFPNAQLETLGGGENPMGQKGKVFALVASAEPTATRPVDIAPTIRRKAEPEVKKNRISVHGGQDLYRDSDTLYRTVGAEFARLSDTYKKYFYGDVGLGIQHHGSDDRLDLYSVNAFTTGYARYKLAVAGLRVFAGNLALEDRNENVFNGGGDVRLGVENDSVSLFANAGLSKNFQHYGLDLGFRF